MAPLLPDENYCDRLGGICYALRVHTMKNASSSTSPRKRTFEYPDETQGSKTAELARRGTNGLCDAQREALFEAGMRIIYGGKAPKPVVRAGH